MKLIKKLLDQTTTDEEQNTLINDIITKYDLPFTNDYLHNTYKFIRYVINNVDVDTELMKNYFSNDDFTYRYDRNRDFLDYHYNYDGNKYRVWLTRNVVYLLDNTLNNDKNMHSSIIRSVEKKELKIQHFERIIREKYDSNSIIRCNNDPEVVDVFKILLNNGLFDYEKYCKKYSTKLELHNHVSMITSGSYTKNANTLK